MKIFIAGASGLLGNNCLKHFSEKGSEVVGSYFSYEQDHLVYYNTLDQDNKNNFDLENFKPDVIVHCGAMTHVDKCETEPELSYQSTVQSTLNLITVAKKINCKLVYISTDYVFDGHDGPYEEDEKTNPLSIYGQHKLEAENAVVNSGLDHLILRITNVYGDEARGKNFIARIVQQCLDGNTLTLKLPKDQYASPTNAWDIARAMYVLLKDKKTGIYHIGGTDYMNRVELALTVLKYFPKANYILEPMTTAQMNQPAARPLLGGFIKRKFSEEYPDFLFSTVDDYVGGKQQNG